MRLAMPFSLEDQILLLGPSLFEEFCGQVIRAEYGTAQHFYGAGGDEGIDIRDGELDPLLRAASGTHLTIWQIKFFRNGIQASQQRQVEKSFQRAMAHLPDRWVLCVPRTLSVDDAKWWDTFCAEKAQEYPKMSLEICPGDHLVGKILDLPAIRNNYIVSPAGSVEGLEKIVARLNDFIIVKHSIERAHALNENEPKSPAAFYTGTIPEWRDIDRGFDAPRAGLGAIWNFIAQRRSQPEGRVPFLLITGRSGDGKTTLLYRAAAELVRHGAGIVLMHKDDRATLDVDQIEEITSDQPAFLFIDTLTRFEETTIRGFFERLQRASQRVLVIGAAIQSLWGTMRLDLGDVADQCEVSIEKLEDWEIDQLLDKLSSWSSEGQNWLGRLAGKTREDQRIIFRKKANRQLLVALLDIQGTGGLQAHLMNELNQLRQRAGKRVEDAVLYVSSLHRFDLRMPKNYIQRLMPDCDLGRDVLAQTDGLLLLTESETAIRTRHALVADTLFQAQQYGEEIYKRLVNNASEDEQKLLGQLLKSLERTDDPNSTRVGLWAVERFPSNSVLCNILAIIHRNLGETQVARALFRQACAADAKNVPTLSSWAILERDQQNSGNREDPAEFTARWLFRQAYAADPRSVPNLSSWAILERDQQNPGNREDPAEFTARWLFRQAYEIDAKNVPNLSAWAILERDQQNSGNREDPAEFTARWLCRRAYEIDAKNVPNLSAWAILERDQQNLGNRENPAEFTARWLCRQAYAANAKNVPTLTAWAILESDQQNPGNRENPAEFTARWLFRQAYAADPRSVPNLSSWAILERDQQNPGNRENPAEFTARWLFQKALDSDARDAASWQELALLEIHDKNFGDAHFPREYSARYCLQMGCQSNPSDAHLRTVYAKFECQQGNLEAGIKLYEQAASLERKARSRSRSFFDIANILFRNKQVTRAHKYLEKAVEADPSDARAQAMLARSYGYQKKWEQSESHFKEAIRLKSDDQITWQWYEQMKLKRSQLID